MWEAPVMISNLKFQISDEPNNGAGRNGADAMEKYNLRCAESMSLAGGLPRAKELDHFGPIKWSGLEMREMGERSDAWMNSSLNFKRERRNDEG